MARTKKIDASKVEGRVSHWLRLREDGIYDFGITVCGEEPNRVDVEILCGMAADSREAGILSHAARTGFLAAQKLA